MLKADLKPTVFDSWRALCKSLSTSPADSVARLRSSEWWMNGEVLYGRMTVDPPEEDGVPETVVYFHRPGVGWIDEEADRSDRAMEDRMEPWWYDDFDYRDELYPISPKEDSSPPYDEPPYWDDWYRD